MISEIQVLRNSSDFYPVFCPFNIKKDSFDSGNGGPFSGLDVPQFRCGGPADAHDWSLGQWEFVLFSSKNCQRSSILAVFSETGLQRFLSETGGLKMFETSADRTGSLVTPPCRCWDPPLSCDMDQSTVPLVEAAVRSRDRTVRFVNFETCHLSQVDT